MMIRPLFTLFFFAVHGTIDEQAFLKFYRQQQKVLVRTHFHLKYLMLYSIPAIKSTAPQIDQSERYYLCVLQFKQDLTIICFIRHYWTLQWMLKSTEFTYPSTSLESTAFPYETKPN